MSTRPVHPSSDSGRPARAQAVCAPRGHPACGQALDVWKQAHADACTRFTKQRNIRLLWERLADAADTLLRTLVGQQTGFAVVAVGGYGRRQCFPYSDIDLLVVVQEGEVPVAAIERVLYGLWDMPLRLGHAVRSIAQTIEAAREDHTVMTALLDMRHVAGNAALSAKLAKQVTRELVGSAVLPFVEAKLRERDARHARALDSRFVLEPNVKDGKGGLRDLNTIWWLARYCYDVHSLDALTKEGGIFTPEDAKAYGEAMEFLSTVRASLHLMAGRAEERLSFDMQLRLAETYHYRQSGEEAAKRFMKHYFHHVTRVGELTRNFCTLLEEEKKRKPSGMAGWFTRPQKLGPFIVRDGRISVGSEKLLRDDPVEILALFHTAQQQGLDIHPHALRAVAAVLPLVKRKERGSERSAQLIKAILLADKGADMTLRKMNEAGVLARFLPEFKHIAGQMQYDRYHTYTVDEHTLVAVANLHRLEQGEWHGQMPLTSRLIRQVHSREVLYLAMLLHDIGKGKGRQEERGEQLAREIARRLHCQAAEVDTIAWLVRHHLLMSEVAFKRDLDDPKTIADFAAKVQSPERLRLLLLVTVADICAVGPKVWNGWKGALLRDLYKRTLAYIAGEDKQAGTLQKRTEFSVLLQHDGWSEEDAGRFVDTVAPAAFWLREESERHILAQLYRRFHERKAVACDVRRHGFHAVTELTLCLEGHPQVLARVAGAAALIGANIVAARLMVAADGANWVSIGLQDVTGAPFDKQVAKEGVLRLYAEAEAGARNLAEDLVRARPRTASRRAKAEPAQVLTDNALSATYSVVEVSGADRIGFLHDVAAALARQGLSIATAQVATYGARAVDVFYVKDAYGHKLVHPVRREGVEHAILSAIQ